MKYTIELLVTILFVSIAILLAHVAAGIRPMDGASHADAVTRNLALLALITGVQGWFK